MRFNRFVFVGLVVTSLGLALEPIPNCFQEAKHRGIYVLELDSPSGRVLSDVLRFTYETGGAFRFLRPVGFPRVRQTKLTLVVEAFNPESKLSDAELQNGVETQLGLVQGMVDSYKNQGTLRLTCAPTIPSRLKYDAVERVLADDGPTIGTDKKVHVPDCSSNVYRLWKSGLSLTGKTLGLLTTLEKVSGSFSLETLTAPRFDKDFESDYFRFEVTIPRREGEPESVFVERKEDAVKVLKSVAALPVMISCVSERSMPQPR